MKVAIAGAGSVGTAIASDLYANGHEVLVFEQDPDVVERLRHTLPITWVAADACEVSSLDAAGLATVDVVVAATGDDEDNLVISLLAKQEFAVPRVVARVNNPNTHGTGCVLSAAIAAYLARGESLPDAVTLAKDFTANAIRNGLPLGKGTGPCDPLSVPRP